MYNGPRVELTFEEFGRDGNVFAIMGTVTKAMKRQLDLPQEEIEAIVDEYRKEAMSGDYHNALRVSMEYVDIIEDEDEEVCDDCGELIEDCVCDEDW